MFRVRFLVGVLVFLLIAAGSHAQECGDLDDSGQIEATDALLLLNKAVEQPVPDLVCPVRVGLPATGQTTCYGESGDVIDCAGTGQDGEFQRGATRNFTDNGDGTITDNVTGLMWEKLSRDGSIHDVDDVYTWPDAFLTKAATLNSMAFAGYSDWRVPNRVELESLRNVTSFWPATYSVFDADCVLNCTVLTCSCTTGYIYWSSTTVTAGALSTQAAWVVDFFAGGVMSHQKAANAAVRAVRGGS